MVDRHKGLDRLCKVYDVLDDHEKEELIRLAEEFLNSQKTMSKDRKLLSEKNRNLGLKTE